MNKFSFVTALHGNERQPVLALASLGVPQFVANPTALQRNLRLVDKDMNASFGTEGNSLEERAARKLLAALPPDRPVVDLHSFSAQSPPFAILVDLAQLPLAETTGLTRVVFMRHSIKSGHALIDFRPGISVECGQHADPKTFRTAQRVIKSVEKGIRKPIKLFEVYGRIEKPGNYRNFQLFDDDEESFYPVLAGENAYNFPGLKARKL